MNLLRRSIFAISIMLTAALHAKDTEIWVDNQTPYRVSARILTSGASNTWSSACDPERVETFAPHTKRKGWWFGCGDGWAFEIRKEWDNEWMGQTAFKTVKTNMSPDKPITLTITGGGSQALIVYISYSTSTKPKALATTIDM